MNRRILKKRAKRFMDSFTREKIPAAFTSKEERRQYVSAFARQYVGQAAHFPETAKEAQHEHPQDENLVVQPHMEPCHRLPARLPLLLRPAHRNAVRPQD